MDTREGDKVDLELVKVDVERTVESERGGDGRDDLGDEPVEVGETGRGNAELGAADVVDGLVVDHERTVGVLEGGVGGENRVVRLNDGRAHLGGRVDGELELGLLTKVLSKTLKEERTETGTCTTTE